MDFCLVPLPAAPVEVLCSLANKQVQQQEMIYLYTQSVNREDQKNEKNSKIDPKFG